MSEIEYREYPALVIDAMHGIEESKPVVWGNAEGQDVTDFQDVLDTTVQEVIATMHETRLADVTPPQVTVMAYAMQIPSWVRKGYERDFIVDVYPDPLTRRDHQDRSVPMYSYKFEVWE